MHISIILPVYNAELHLKSTIDSILNQTYPYFELIIIDDCSTDSSYNIITTFIQNDNRIFYFKLKKNSGGPATPRNFGINKAKNSLIAFVDSDDIWHPQKLEIQYDFLKNNPNIKFISSIKTVKKFSSNSIHKKFYFTILNYHDLLYKNFVNNSSVLIYKEYLQPFYFCSKYIAIEDAKQWLEITKNGINCYLLHIPLIYYRKVENSLSNNKIKMLNKRYFLIKSYSNQFFTCLYITIFLFYSVFNFKQPLLKKRHYFI
jgi:teichuronic acid biosynthesis glycosyltransferase TuaG